MKFRMIAAVLIWVVGAWVAIASPQSAPSQAETQQTQAQAPAPPATTDSGKAAEKSGCPCCEHMNHQAQGSSSDHPSMGCCHGKDAKAAPSTACCKGKDMACCKKDGQGKQAAAGCCHGKDGQMCAKQDSQHCCDGSAGKGCCGKNNTTSSSKDAKGCCSAMHEHCCANNAQG